MVLRALRGDLTCLKNAKINDTQTFIALCINQYSGSFWDLIGDAEPEDAKNVFFRVGNFHPPGTFIVVSNIYSAEGRPSRRLEGQFDLSHKLIPLEPFVINKGFFFNRVK